jgi:hypothetical protein
MLICNENPAGEGINRRVATPKPSARVYFFIRAGGKTTTKTFRVRWNPFVMGLYPEQDYSYGEFTPNHKYDYP